MERVGAVLAGIAVALTAVVASDTADAASSTCHVPAAYTSIQSAVDEPSCDLILVNAGPFHDDLEIGRSLTLVGSGPGVTTIKGNPSAGAVLSVTGDHVEVRSLTLTGGAPGIRNTGVNLIVEDVVVEDNSMYYSGAGVLNAGGSMTIRRSTIRGNTATTEDGGGIHSTSSLTLFDSTVSGNVAGRNGGGVSASSGTLMVVNSTISGNEAGAHGGGISTSSSTDIRSATLTANVADRDASDDGDGGGLWAPGPDGTRLQSTIIAGNHDRSGGVHDCADLGSALASFGHNLIGSSPGCDFTPAMGDRFDQDPRLTSLGAFGGPTATHSPTPASPVIDAVAAETCNYPIATPGADQRGVTRLTDGNGDGVPVCDIGAVEWVPRNLDLQTKRLARQGKRIKLTASVTPCGAHEGDVVTFGRKGTEIAAIPLDADCIVQWFPKLKKDTRFWVSLPAEPDHEASSDRQKVKVKVRR